METTRLLVLTILAVAPVLAQSQSFNNMRPNAMLAEVPGEISETYSPTGYLLAAVPAASPSAAPAAHRVFDKKFIAVMAALGGAESLRFTTHKLVLDHEFDAGAPWVTSIPANQHLVAKYAGIYAAEFIVAYELKKSHSWLPGDRIIEKFWWAYPATMLPIHIKNGVRSIRTRPPTCPVEECELQ